MISKFFNLTEHHEVQIPMYGLTHLITVIGMLLLLVLILLHKKQIKRVVNNHLLIRRFLIVYLLLEVFYWSLIWGYRIEPFYERFPLHLCGSLSILMSVLLLLQKRNLVR